MGSKYRWFDFAGSNPQYKGQLSLDELLAQEKSATSPVKSPPKASSSGDPKRCTKGTSCGSTCIFSGDKCILEFPDLDVQQTLSKVRDMLVDRVRKGGISKEEAEGYITRVEGTTLAKTRGKELAKGLENLEQEFTKNGSFDKEGYEKALNHVIDTIIPGTYTPRTKNTPLTPEEIEGIKANRETWTALAELQREVASRKAAGDEMSPAELREKLRPIVEPKRQEISPAQIEIAKALLPESERDYYKTAGALEEKDTGGRFAANGKLDALPSSYGPLRQQTASDAENRLNLLVGMYLAHGGKDIASGQRVPITHSDLEHNIAESHGGKAAEQGLNYSPLKTSLNVGRGSKDHQEYFDGLLAKYDFDSNGKLTPESRDKVNQKLQKAAESGALKKEISTKAKSAKTVEDLDEIITKIEQIPPGKPKDKLMNKLVSGFLSSYGGVKIAETARAGLQTHMRAEQPHYWYGDKMEGGGKAAKNIMIKMRELLEKGDESGMQKLVKIMQEAPSRIKTYVNDNVAPDPSTLKGGKPVLTMGGDKTREIIKAIKTVREEIINEINSL